MRRLSMLRDVSFEGKVHGKPVAFTVEQIALVSLCIEEHSAERPPCPHEYVILYASNDDVPEGFEFAAFTVPAERLLAEGLCLYIRALP